MAGGRSLRQRPGRAVCLRGQNRGHLLPPVVPLAHAAAPQHALFCHTVGGTGSGLSSLQALPPGYSGLRPRSPAGTADKSPHRQPLRRQHPAGSARTITRRVRRASGGGVPARLRAVARRLPPRQAPVARPHSAGTIGQADSHRRAGMRIRQPVRLLPLLQEAHRHHTARLPVRRREQSAGKSIIITAAWQAKQTIRRGRYQ